MEDMDTLNHFWNKKRVFLTGHTGFKGGWLALWLHHLGAHVTGYALAPSMPLHDHLRLDHHIDSQIGDIRDRTRLESVMRMAEPDIVIHMAAQALVPRSLIEPVPTFETNIMGTAYVIDAAAALPTPPAVTLVITSDKVYRNTNTAHAFAEQDALGGDDPYSASKAAAELVTQAMQSVIPTGMVLATARAGNVIGGGDFTAGRLIPDIVRAWEQRQPLVLRSPHATRPWQHVLDCLAGYLAYVPALAAQPTTPKALNFGPATMTPLDVTAMVGLMRDVLCADISVLCPPSEVAAIEKQHLAVDASAAYTHLGWQPRLPVSEALRWTAAWHKACASGQSMDTVTLEQIDQYGVLS